MNNGMIAGVKEYRGEQTIGIAKSADRSGLPGELDGLENDLCKLGAMVSELRMRLDNVMVAEQPTPTNGQSSVEPRRPRCNFSEGIAGFRDRVKSLSQSLQDVMNRLDL